MTNERKQWHCRDLRSLNRMLVQTTTYTTRRMEGIRRGRKKKGIKKKSRKHCNVLEERPGGTHGTMEGRKENRNASILCILPQTVPPIPPLSFCAPPSFFPSFPSFRRFLPSSHSFLSFFSFLTLFHQSFPLSLPFFSHPCLKSTGESPKYHSSILPFLNSSTLPFFQSSILPLFHSSNLPFF